MAAEHKESPANNPGLHVTPDEATKGYIMQQTMYRIKDPKVSLDFYSRVLGMSLLKRLDFPEMKFSLYFLGYEDTTSAPSNPVERTSWTFSKKATIELTQLRMRVLMIEDSNNAVSNCFLLDDDSSIPFSGDNISKSMEQIDVSDIDSLPLIRENSGFSFLLPRVD